MIKHWKFLDRKVLLDHPRMKIVEDSVLLPNNKEISYIRQAETNLHSVAVIAINQQNKILLQREYSYPPDEILFQFPGGQMEKDENIIDAANRELSEESGWIGRNCQILGSFYLDNRRSNRKQFVVLCKDLIRKESPKDAEEFIESEWFSRDEIIKIIQNDQTKNATLLAAFSIWNSFDSAN